MVSLTAQKLADLFYLEMILKKFISANYESDAYEIANKTLEDLQRYMLSNQLHINLSKCI